MAKFRTHDTDSTLPEPIALTPDQLRQVATKTAGGLSLAFSSTIIRAGGIPPMLNFDIAAGAIAQY